LYFDSFF